MIDNRPVLRNMIFDDLKTLQPDLDIDRGRFCIIFFVHNLLCNINKKVVYHYDSSAISAKITRID